MRTALPFAGRALPLLVLSGLAACACPPLVEAYDTPAATLATWQAQLCRDDQAGEYRCLSSGLQQRMGGFETYFAARRQLLDERPLLAWLLARADLPSHAIGRIVDPDGRTAALVFEVDEARFTIGFLRETRAFYTLEDGSRLSALQSAPVSGLLREQGGRQWLLLQPPRRRPAPGEGEPPEVHSILVAPEWKIDSIEGLVLGAEVAS